MRVNLLAGLLLIVYGARPALGELPADPFANAAEYASPSEPQSPPQAPSPGAGQGVGSADSSTTNGTAGGDAFLAPIPQGQEPIQQSEHVQSPEVGPLTPLTPDDAPGWPTQPPMGASPPPEFGPYGDGPAFGNPPIRPVPEEPPFVVPYQTRVVGTVVAGQRNELGMTDVDLSTVFAFPRTEGFAITPGFQTFFLNGPRRTDLPGELYDARVEFALKRPWNDRFSYLLTIAPGIYSDFDNTGSDALRVMSRALGFYKVSRTTDFTFGLLYVDRDNLALLPAIGVIHVPEPDVRIELVFPKPKVAARISHGGSEEWWAYVTGEFGGGSFAIERANGDDDVVTYSDWRLLVGMEGNFPGSKTVFQNIPTVFFEAGFVFNRELEYESNRGDYDPGNTGLVRAGFVY